MKKLLFIPFLALMSCGGNVVNTGEADTIIVAPIDSVTVTHVVKYKVIPMDTLVVDSNGIEEEFS